MITKAELAGLVDAYADAKASGNKYLVKRMIGDLEQALNEVFGEGPGGAEGGTEGTEGTEGAGEY